VNSDGDFLGAGFAYRNAPSLLVVALRGCRVGGQPMMSAQGSRVGRSDFDQTGASDAVAIVLNEPITADPGNRACRAGHSNYVRAASERIFIERRGVAPRSTKVAVSLRRDEPCSTPLAALWPVDSHDAFTQSGVHRVLQTKDQRLVSTERDGYVGLSRITKSFSINSAI
jgi:hypothetical protein